MTQDNLQKLLDFTSRCDSLRKKLTFGTTSLTPLNLEDERNKFFSILGYNPIFIYKKFDDRLAHNLLKNLRARLKTLPVPYELRNYLQTYLKDLKLLAKTKASIGSDDFAYYAKKLFAIDEYEIKEALLSLPNLDFENYSNNTLYNASQIAQIFETVLKEYNLCQYKVVVDDSNPYVIWTGTSTINIGSSIKRYAKNVKRLIVHEIETHALQRHNLSLYNNPFIKLVPYKEFNLYGEGLAVYNEIVTGTITKKAYNQYVLRLTAVSMLDKSFREIFDYLLQFVPAKQAFLITYRVKRGMRDTKKAGGFPKDALYLLGYKTILDYVNAGLRPEFLYISKNPHLSSLLLSENLLYQTDIKLPSFWRESYNTPHISPLAVV